MTADKPTVVFVPGAWHLSDGFDLCRSQLSTLGYPTIGLDHPSIGDDRSKALAEDTANIRSALLGLLEDDKEVVVICHSYGGVPTGNAVEKLGYPERKEKGERGGVVMVIYMAAFALPVGISLLDALGGSHSLWVKHDVRIFSLTSSYLAKSNQIFLF
jgi:pimeloyl-ACP methyl ester carboxylesterase